MNEITLSLSKLHFVKQIKNNQIDIQISIKDYKDDIMLNWKKQYKEIAKVTAINYRTHYIVSLIIIEY